MTENREPFTVHCGACGHEWAPCYLPAPVEVIAKVGKRPCPMCDSANVLLGPLPRATRDGDAIGWLASGDTGISSETIWSVMMGRPFRRPPFGPDIPHDADDFGRCYRLLKVMPAWRERMGEVAARYPKWAPLVAAWDELTALFEQKDYGRIYHRICELRGVRP